MLSSSPRPTEHNIIFHSLCLSPLHNNRADAWDRLMPSSSSFSVPDGCLPMLWQFCLVAVVVIVSMSAYNLAGNLVYLAMSAVQRVMDQRRRHFPSLARTAQGVRSAAGAGARPRGLGSRRSRSRASLHWVQLVVIMRERCATWTTPTSSRSILRRWLVLTSVLWAGPTSSLLPNARRAFPADFHFRQGRPLVTARKRNMLGIAFQLWRLFSSS